MSKNARICLYICLALLDLIFLGCIINISLIKLKQTPNESVDNQTLIGLVVSLFGILLPQLLSVVAPIVHNYAAEVTGTFSISIKLIWNIFFGQVKLQCWCTHQKLMHATDLITPQYPQFLWYFDHTGQLLLPEENSIQYDSSDNSTARKGILTGIKSLVVPVGKVPYCWNLMVLRFFTVLSLMVLPPLLLYVILNFRIIHPCPSWQRNWMICLVYWLILYPNILVDAHLVGIKVCFCQWKCRFLSTQRITFSAQCVEYLIKICCWLSVDQSSLELWVLLNNCYTRRHGSKRPEYQTNDAKH